MSINEAINALTSKLRDLEHAIAKTQSELIGVDRLPLPKAEAKHRLDVALQNMIERGRTALADRVRRSYQPAGKLSDLLLDVTAGGSRVDPDILLYLHSTDYSDLIMDAFSEAQEPDNAVPLADRDKLKAGLAMRLDQLREEHKAALDELGPLGEQLSALTREHKRQREQARLAERNTAEIQARDAMAKAQRKFRPPSPIVNEH